LSRRRPRATAPLRVLWDTRPAACRELRENRLKTRMIPAELRYRDDGSTSYGWSLDFRRRARCDWRRLLRVTASRFMDLQQSLADSGCCPDVGALGFRLLCRGGAFLAVFTEVNAFPLDEEIA